MADPRIDQAMLALRAAVLAALARRQGIRSAVSATDAAKFEEVGRGWTVMKQSALSRSHGILGFFRSFLRR